MTLTSDGSGGEIERGKKNRGEHLGSMETMWALLSYTGKMQKRPTWAFLTGLCFKIPAK